MNAAFGALQGDHFPVILAEIAPGRRKRERIHTQ